MSDEARALRAYLDVLAVEHNEDAGVMRIVTLSDVYHAVPREGLHMCPDREYNDVALCKHVIASDVTRGRLDVPTGWLVVDDLDDRDEADDTSARTAIADGGQLDAGWIVRGANGTEREAGSRSEAEEIKAEAESLGLDVEIVPPGEDADDSVDVVEHVDPEPVDSAAEELPERSVAEDPLDWIPSDFVDTIDGSPAINRRGFEVLAHFYDVDVYSELEVPPEEHGFEYCRVKARAVRDGRECEAYGSAHVDRGDDPELLLEMADTRARKRALSIATGVGAVAVEELRNEVSR